MGRRIQVVSARIIENAIEGAIGFDPEQLVDATERQVMTPSRLIAARIGEPRLEAHALNEHGRLPGGRHPASTPLVHRFARDLSTAEMHTCKWLANARWQRVSLSVTSACARRQRARGHALNVASAAERSPSSADGTFVRSSSP